jgi:hypothetical protein
LPRNQCICRRKSSRGDHQPRPEEAEPVHRLSPTRVTSAGGQRTLWPDPASGTTAGSNTSIQTSHSQHLPSPHGCVAKRLPIRLVLSVHCPK